MARAAWQCSACQSSGVVHAELSHSPLVCDSTCTAVVRTGCCRNHLRGECEQGGKKGTRCLTGTCCCYSMALQRPNRQKQLPHCNAANPSATKAAACAACLRNRRLLARVGGRSAMHAGAPGARQPKLHWVDVLAHRGAAAVLQQWAGIEGSYKQQPGRGRPCPYRTAGAAAWE